MPNYYIHLWDMGDREIVLSLPVAGKNEKIKKSRRPIVLKETRFQKAFRFVKNLISNCENTAN